MGRTAIVVGGGIGGLGTAAGLIRRGWSVRVLEQAPEFAEVGAAISLWPNAFRALETIGITAELGAGSLGVAGGLRDWRGRWIVRMDGDDAVAEHTSSAVVVHRAELLSALLDAVPAACRLPGVRVRGVRREGECAVVETDGGELRADVVIGADGLHSAVRAALWPGAAPPRYSGCTVWRMVLPRPVSLAGRRVWAETWGPGALFGTFPVPGDRLYCYASSRVPPGGRAGDTELAEVRSRFAGWCDPIPEVLAAASEDQVLRNDVYYLPPLRSYVSGPVALLGDAAHAMTPNLGQGGCQALEDAATLAVLLEGDVGLELALRRYDELRRPRTQELARRSLLGGTVAHLRPAPVRVVRNAALRMLPRSFFVRSLAKPFGWQPPVRGNTDSTRGVIS